MKIKPSIFFLINFIFLFIVSCRTIPKFEKDLILEYSTKNTLYKTKIHLKKNGRFIYNHRNKLTHQNSKGTWKKEGKFIILRSDDVYKTGIINFKEEKNTSQEIKIILKDSKNNPIPYANLIINNAKDKIWTTDKNGIATLPKQTISKITIGYLGGDYTYNVNDFNLNKLTLNIRIDDLSLKYFDFEKLEIYGSKLVNAFGETFKLIK